MRFDIEKAQTWKGLSYPLKTSMLKDALEKNKVDCNMHLVYCTPQQHDEKYNVIECHYWLANQNVDYDRFYIRAGVVKSEKRKLAETLLINEVLPKLIDFIKNKIKLSPNSTTKDKQDSFQAVFVDDKILINY